MYLYLNNTELYKTLCSWQPQKMYNDTSGTEAIQRITTEEWKKIVFLRMIKNHWNYGKKILDNAVDELTIH